MSQILLVTSSPRGDASHSANVARSLVATLRAAEPSATLAVRDLVREPLPHISEAFVTGLGKAPELRSEEERAAVARSDELVAELLASDVVVIAAGMINFGIPSSLKAWVDHVARAGLTFRFTSQGPEGLAKGKKVFLVTSRGGIYSEGAMRASNFVEPYLERLLAFLGMTDVRTIEIEGVALGEQAAARALQGAMARAQSIGVAAAA